MNTKWMDPYERVALLEQELENIEEREAARKQSRRLTLEEVVYWLVVVGCVGLAERVAAREVEWVKRSRNVRRNILRSRTHPHWYRREAGFVAFLCGEALRALGADQ